MLGTGITRCYPSENQGLADAIADSGALVSQFRPTTHPSRYTSPRRNVVTSGISQGTIGIEAKHLRCQDAGVPRPRAWQEVFLNSILVESEPWARDYVDKCGAIEVTGPPR